MASKETPEPDSETFICIYGPGRAITSPNVTIQSLDITQYTDTIFGHFRPKLSSSYTLQLHYDAPRGVEPKIHNLQDQEDVRHKERSDARLKRSEERLKRSKRKLKAQRAKSEAQEKWDTYVCIYGPDRLITSPDIEILDVKVVKSENQTRFGGSHRLIIDFQAPKGVRAEVYDCQPLAFSRHAGSPPRPRRRYVRAYPDGRHHFEGHTMDEGNRFSRKDDSSDRETCGRVYNPCDKIDTHSDSFSSTIRDVVDICNRVNDKLDRVSGRLDGMTDRLDGMIDRLDHMTDKLDHMTDKLDHMNDTLGCTNDRLDRVNGRLDGIIDNVRSVGKIFADIKAAVEQMVGKKQAPISVGALT